MKIRKMLALLMAVCVLLTVTPNKPVAYAAESTKVLSSAAFHSFIVTYDENTRELSTEGRGKIPALSDETATPWAAYSNQITILSIGEGITSIGAGAFAGLVNLDTVIFPSTIKYIESDAFIGCNNITNIIYPGQMSFLEELINENSVRELMRSLKSETDTRTATGTNPRLTTKPASPRSTGNNRNSGGSGYNRGESWDSGDNQNFEPEDRKQTKEPDTEKKTSDSKKTDPKKSDSEKTTPESPNEKPVVPDYVKKDENGRVIEEKVTQPDGTSKITKYTYSYDGEVQLKTEQTLDKSGNVLSEATISTSKYITAEGEHVESTSNSIVYANGDQQSITDIVKKDDSGKTISEESYSETKDKNGKVIGKETRVNQYENGELKKSTETTIDKDNNSVEKTIDYSGEGGKDYGQITTKTNGQVTRYESYTVEKSADGKTTTTSGEIKNNKDDPESVSSYTKKETENEDGSVSVENSYHGNIDGKTNVNIQDTIQYDKDGNFTGGSRNWSDNEVSNGTASIDEQGRITSGTVTYHTGSVDNITSVNYADDGSSTKTGTYTEGGSGKTEQYTETTSADGRNTSRQGTVTKPIEGGGSQSFSFNQETVIKDTGEKTVDRNETDSAGNTVGDKREYDSNGTYTQRTESYTDSNGNSDSTVKRIKVVDAEVYEEPIGGSYVKKTADGGTISENYQVLEQEGATGYNPTGRAGTITTITKDGEVTEDSYTRTYNQNAADPISGTVTTTKSDGTVETRNYTGTTYSNSTVINEYRNGDVYVNGEKVGTFDDVYHDDGNGNKYTYNAVTQTDNTYNISVRTTSSDGNVTQIVSNNTDGTQRYYVSENDRPTYGWEKTSTSTSQYTVTYVNGKSTKTIYQVNQSDNSREKKVEEETPQGTYTYETKMEGGVWKTRTYLNGVEQGDGKPADEGTINSITNESIPDAPQNITKNTTNYEVPASDNSSEASAPASGTTSSGDQTNQTNPNNANSNPNNTGEAQPANTMGNKMAANRMLLLAAPAEPLPENTEDDEEEELLPEGEEQESEPLDSLGITLKAFTRVGEGTKNKLQAMLTAPDSLPTDELTDDDDKTGLTEKTEDLSPEDDKKSIEGETDSKTDDADPVQDDNETEQNAETLDGNEPSSISKKEDRNGEQSMNVQEENDDPEQHVTVQENTENSDNDKTQNPEKEIKADQTVPSRNTGITEQTPTVPYKSSLADVFAEKEEDINLDDVANLPVKDPVTLGKKDEPAVQTSESKEVDVAPKVETTTVTESNKEERLSADAEKEKNETSEKEVSEFTEDAVEADVTEKPKAAEKSVEDNDKNEDVQEKAGEIMAQPENGTEKDEKIIKDEQTEDGQSDSKEEGSSQQTEISDQEENVETPDSDTQSEENVEVQGESDDPGDNGQESVTERRAREREEALMNGMTDSERKAYEEMKAREEERATAEAERQNAAEQGDSSKTDESGKTSDVSENDVSQNDDTGDSSGTASPETVSQNSGTADGSEEPGKEQDIQQNGESEEDDGLVTISAEQFLEDNKESAPKLVPELPPAPVVASTNEGTSGSSDSGYSNNVADDYNGGSGDDSSTDESGYDDGEDELYQNNENEFYGPDFYENIENMTEEELAEYMRKVGLPNGQAAVTNGTQTNVKETPANQTGTGVDSADKSVPDSPSPNNNVPTDVPAAGTVIESAQQESSSSEPAAAEQQDSEPDKVTEEDAANEQQQSGGDEPTGGPAASESADSGQQESGESETTEEPAASEPAEGGQQESGGSEPTEEPAASEPAEE